MNKFMVKITNCLIEIEVIQKRCDNCRYSEAYNNQLYCIGVREPLKVKEDDSCDEWRYRNAEKNIW